MTTPILTGILPNNLFSTGTWTPTIYGASTAGTTTYGTQDGHYIKIGQLVKISFQVFYTAATGTGNILMGGLPFTIFNESGNEEIGPLLSNLVTFPTGCSSIVCVGMPNTETVSFQACGTTTANLNIQIANSTATWFGSLTYLSAT